MAVIRPNRKWLEAAAEHGAVVFPLGDTEYHVTVQKRERSGSEDNEEA